MQIYYQCCDHVQVSVDGLGVVGADVRLSVHHLDNNGDHQSLATNITLLDDGVAGNVSIHDTHNAYKIFRTHTKNISDPDLRGEDGVYSGHISPYLLSPGSYQLQLTVTDNGLAGGSYREPTGTFIPSAGYFQHQSCMPHDVIHCSFTGSFIRHVEGPTINLDTGGVHASPGPRRITDFAAEYLDTSHQVELSWTVPDSLAEIRSYTLSYSDNVDTVIRGLETRDVVITRDTIAGHDGYVTQVLPAPDNVSGVVYFIIRAEDSSGAWSKLSNIVYLNITRDAGHVSNTLVGEDGEYNYTLLGVILGIITVFSLLTILAVSVWLHRRRTQPGKLRSLNGFSNKVSSGVNVVIDKSESRGGLDTRHVHVPNINNPQPSSTSFANNITPTYWSASQLLADHEHRKRDNHSNHHLHHGHHYHQYYPVHHQTSHYEDHDSDIVEDNNNDHNTSDQSSSTIVMLNTSVSSSNTGTGSVRKKNITQV